MVKLQRWAKGDGKIRGGGFHYGSMEAVITTVVCLSVQSSGRLLKEGNHKHCCYIGLLAGIHTIIFRIISWNACGISCSNQSDERMSITISRFLEGLEIFGVGSQVSVRNDRLGKENMMT